MASDSSGIAVRFVLVAGMLTVFAVVVIMIVT